MAYIFYSDMAYINKLCKHNTARGGGGGESGAGGRQKFNEFRYSELFIFCSLLSTNNLVM